jgi:hypothetical protein
MHMFDAREIEDSLCNTSHECGFLYNRSVEPCRLLARTDALLGMVSIDLLLLPPLLRVGVEQTIC